VSVNVIKYNTKVCLRALSECGEVYDVKADQYHFMTKNMPLAYQKHICVDKTLYPVTTH